jgi:hypothetical protein
LNLSWLQCIARPLKTGSAYAAISLYLKENHAIKFIFESLEPLIQFAFFCDKFSVQVRPQSLRYQHTAVLLLIIFDNRHPRTPYREPASIQRVDVLRFLPAAVSNVGAPRLERLEI